MEKTNITLHELNRDDLTDLLSGDAELRLDDPDPDKVYITAVAEAAQVPEEALTEFFENAGAEPEAYDPEAITGEEPLSELVDAINATGVASKVFENTAWESVGGWGNGAYYHPARDAGIMTGKTADGRSAIVVTGTQMRRMATLARAARSLYNSQDGQYDCYDIFGERD